ncbi:phospholipase D-like domain-containing protein [soil metagenome]
MKRISILLFFVIFNSLPLLASQPPFKDNSEIELVESVPAETILERSDLHRASDVWLKMFNDAKKTIDIEMFYFANEKNEVLEPILQSLKEAAKRGVTIRIIVDSSFYSGSEHSVDLLDGIKNITIKKLNMKAIAGGIMHAKFFIVDSENVFTGSQNMDWRALKHIHEMGVRVKNVQIGYTFEEIFNIDYKLCDHPDLSSVKNLLSPKKLEVISRSNPVRFESSEFGSVSLYPAFSPEPTTPQMLEGELESILRIINNAKEKISIQMYSYNIKNNFTQIDDALRAAAKKGVKIKIIFSNWAIRTEATETIKSLSQVQGIEIKFSNIPEFSAGFIPYARVEHCKYFIADSDVSFISSANWEKGYFYDTRNASMVINNNRINASLQSVFMRDWNGDLTETVDVQKVYEPVKKK